MLEQVDFKTDRGFAAVESARLYNTGQFWAALELLTDAVNRDPEYGFLRSLRGQLLLLFGRWSEAWSDVLAYNAEASRLWWAIQLGNHRGLVKLVDDQGRGDAIQNIRYAAWLDSLGFDVTVSVRPELETLLHRAPGVTLTDREPDYTVNLNAMPAVAGQRPDAEPAAAYLTAEPWMARSRIGICWCGNPNHGRTAYRDIPVQHFDFLNFPRSVLLNPWAAPRFGMRIPAWREGFDMADLAGAVASVDLVVTCDTAQAHLAGALGKPCWLLLSSSPDARWMLGRDDTPWYKSVRIFRQETPGDWSGVFERVAVELENFG